MSSHVLEKRDCNGKASMFSFLMHQKLTHLKIFPTWFHKNKLPKNLKQSDA